MIARILRSAAPFAVALLVVTHPAIHAEEGMWPFDNPPVKLLKEKYGFTPTNEWLDNIRVSSVGIKEGGSVC